MDIWDSTVRMVSALAVVLGVMVVVLYFAKGILRKRGGWLGGEPMIQVLGNLYLGGRKSITVVEVAGEVLVVGATPGEMVLLSKMRKAEWNTKNADVTTQNADSMTMGDIRKEELSHDHH